MSGKFLLGATDGGATGTTIKSNASVAAGGSGGEASHTLTVSELASHTHPLSSTNATFTGQSSTSTNKFWQNIDGQGWTFGYSNNSKYTGFSPNVQVSITPKGTISGNTDSKGSGTAHNIMPPFLAVYMWKRTS